MNNDTNNSQNNKFSTDANTPSGEAKSSHEAGGRLPGIEELKDYGKKSLIPLIDLVSKYKQDVNPYFSALSKGLRAAADVYKDQPGTTRQEDMPSRQAEDLIGSWFREADDWLNGINQKVQTGNTKDLLNYLGEQAQRRPAMMFSVSYMAGIIFGRIGRHLGRQYKTETNSHFDQADLFGGQTGGSESLKH